MELEQLLHALADRTRLRLLNLLRDREVCVCYFVECLRESQPKISRHLAYLRKSGLVSARRDGLWQHYRVVLPGSPELKKVLAAVMSTLENDRELDKDVKRLERACCAPEKFVKLQPAPTPTTVQGDSK